ncbi:MAG: antitoxin [Actinobacteria bacterium]|nr:antitoxin [Actinomycetota bacterium]
MKTLTIRGIDQKLSETIKETAKAESMSVNQLVVNILKKYFGHSKKRQFTKKYHDLDDLFGNWSEEEYKTITKELEGQNQIDWELWQ